jgi:hypothetical protein
MIYDFVDSLIAELKKNKIDKPSRTLIKRSKIEMNGYLFTNQHW